MTQTINQDTPSEGYVCLNIECRYHALQPFPFCPKCGHRHTLIPQSQMRARRWIAGILSLGVGCFLLLIAVFASFLVGNKSTAIRVNDVAALLLLYGLGLAFFLGSVSLIVGGGRWFIRSLISFGRRGGSGRLS